MAIKAIARVISVGTDIAAGNYNINCDIAATDGLVDSSFSVLVQVPLASNKSQINAALLDAVAARISVEFSQPVNVHDIFHQLTFDRG